MFWLWLIGTLIVGLVAGLYVGTQAELHAKIPLIQSLLASRTSDRDFLFRVLRRELANWMIWREPDQYQAFYEKLYLSTKVLMASEPRIKQAKYKFLTEKYPMYSDFDLLGVREHVLYGDAFNSISHEDIEQYFKDIIEFQALLIVNDRDRKFFMAAIENDLKHIKEYIPRIKDTKLKARLLAAVREYWAFRQGSRDKGGSLPNGELLYETETFSARWLDHPFELTWGYHFKDTDEYALHTIFDDYKNNDTYVSYYQSDATFKDYKMLHEICME